MLDFSKCLFYSYTFTCTGYSCSCTLIHCIFNVIYLQSQCIWFHFCLLSMQRYPVVVFLTLWWNLSLLPLSSLMIHVSNFICLILLTKILLCFPRLSVTFLTDMLTCINVSYSNLVQLRTSKVFKQPSCKKQFNFHNLLMTCTFIILRVDLTMISISVHKD